MLAIVVVFSDPDRLLSPMTSIARLVNPENEAGVAAPVNLLSLSKRVLPKYFLQNTPVRECRPCEQGTPTKKLFQVT